MNTFATRGQARRGSRVWKRLIDAVDRVEPYWFSKGGMEFGSSTLIGTPFEQAYEGRTYWVERGRNGEDENDNPTFEFRVYVFDGVAVLRVGEHEQAHVALGSAMFLAAV